ncbi:unnamed protein product, partial [Prunus brigantina]
MVDLNAESVPKRGRQTEAPRAILAAEDDDAPADPVTIACPSRTIQFTNHMILGSQMELYEIDELRKRLFREEARCAFRLQASTSMDMWLCMKWTITTAECTKKAYEGGRVKGAEAGKALQDHAHLLRDKQAAERQVKASEAKLAKITAALETALVAIKDVQVAKGAVQAIRGYRSSEEFTVLLVKEVGSEMADLLYRFKRYNPGRKLNLNFIADPPPLPEGLTEEMIKDYEGEDSLEEVFAVEVPTVAEEPHVDATVS